MSIREEKSCLSKKKYEDFNHALRDMKALKRKTGHAFHVYECEFCGHYHVGHARNPNTKVFEYSRLFLQNVRNVKPLKGAK